jgi:hypothetical protein
MDHFLPLYEAKREKIKDPHSLERYLVRENQKFMSLIKQHSDLCNKIKYNLIKQKKQDLLSVQLGAVENMERCETFEQWKQLVEYLLNLN